LKKAPQRNKAYFLNQFAVLCMKILDKGKINNYSDRCDYGQLAVTWDDDRIKLFFVPI
jgi:hypothetical protein